MPIYLTPIAPACTTGDPARPRLATKDLRPVAVGSTPAELLPVIVDAESRAIPLGGKALRMVFAAKEDGTSPITKYEIGTGLALVGNQIMVRHTATLTATPGRFHYWLWNVTNDVLLRKGAVCIEAAAVDIA